MNVRIVLAAWIPGLRKFHLMRLRTVWQKKRHERFIQEVYLLHVLLLLMTRLKSQLILLESHGKPSGIRMSLVFIPDS